MAQANESISIRRQLLTLLRLELANNLPEALDTLSHPEAQFMNGANDVELLAHYERVAGQRGVADLFAWARANYPVAPDNTLNTPRPGSSGTGAADPGATGDASMTNTPDEPAPPARVLFEPNAAPGSVPTMIGFGLSTEACDYVQDHSTEINNLSYELQNVLRHHLHMLKYPLDGYASINDIIGAYNVFAERFGENWHISVRKKGDRRPGCL